MKNLSQLLDESTIGDLKKEIAQKNSFPGISFEEAMSFILTDGVLPQSGLPTKSFLKLEDWLRDREMNSSISYSATELKNKTGEIVEKVLQGKTIRLMKHGRAFAEIKPLARS